MKLSTAILFVTSFSAASVDAGYIYKYKSKDNKNEPCLEVTITGTRGGPAAFGGLAGAGTLVSYGTRENDCRDVLLQFDAGRGTTLRLSEIGVLPRDLDAVFLTHLHGDHVDDLPILVQDRWSFGRTNIDIVCGQSEILDCGAFLENIDAVYEISGVRAERIGSVPGLNAAGPPGIVVPTLVSPTDTAETVWESGDVRVTAIRTNHVSGSLAYRVDTPAGSVVIGGDASNDDEDFENRVTSTSANVETLAQNADILVHSVIHPVLGPGSDTTFPPLLFNRQPSAPDVGAMAKRADVRIVIPSHMVPAINEESVAGTFTFAGGPLKKSDYQRAIREGGFRRTVVVPSDLIAVRIP